MTSRTAAFRPRSPFPPEIPAKPSVLIVTEDEALAGACRSALEQVGYTVTVASHSGHALLECMSGRRADVLLTELSMPDGSGPALAERLRRYFPDLGTVYVASAGAPAEGPDVLVRPFSRDALLARIRAAATS